ncbi:MAG TPA: alpha/beta hydrolase [Membranihabitans sp.]|nr:alpha/beta hydrolase [Membranihabitans sp.]
MKTYLFLHFAGLHFYFILLFSLCLSSMLIAQTNQVTSGYIESNGINYYYEIQGEGEPLLLLHGGLGSIEMFRPVLPSYAKSRKLILVDLQGHGRTALGDRKLDLTAMGDDMATILKELNIEKTDAMGFSLGGGVAFRLAVQHPPLVEKLILVSAGYSTEGFYPEIQAQQSQVNSSMADMMKETPMYQSYAEIAPQPEDFPRLLGAIGEFMTQPYDWSDDVQKLKMPVMIAFGDSDMFRPEHMVEFYQLLGGGQKDGGWMGENMSQNRLAILPGATHYNIIMSPLLVPTVMTFLEK